MNKRILMVALAGLTMAGGALAAGDAGGFKTGSWLDDVHFNAGVKVWVNRWQSWFATSGAGKRALTSDDTEMTPIPFASVRYKDFFATGSYFAETEYGFNDFDTRSDTVVGDINYTAKRREWDGSVGYMVLPNLAITAGYKDIRQSFTNEKLNYFTGEVEEARFSPLYFNFKGPIVGLAGSVPIGHGIGLYGSFAYGWLRESAGQVNNRGRKKTETADYVLAEGGLSYTHNMENLPVYLPLSSATAFAGYRFQAVDINSGVGAFRGNKATDYTKGFVVGVNFAY
jgi:hypothetical protein